ncbi:hypothetical protein GE21DRAFT_1317421 [Neurospora crassa]|nr:hypothetical protein GE21DRAFT_1317421 [Neurospora crassa]
MSMYFLLRHVCGRLPKPFGTPHVSGHDGNPRERSMQDGIPFRFSRASGSGITVLEILPEYVMLFPHQTCWRLNHVTLFKVMTVLARDYASCIYALGDVAWVYCKAKRGHISEAGAMVCIRMEGCGMWEGDGMGGYRREGRSYWEADKPGELVKNPEVALLRDEMGWDGSRMGVLALDTPGPTRKVHIPKSRGPIRMGRRRVPTSMHRNVVRDPKLSRHIPASFQRSHRRLRNSSTVLSSVLKIKLAIGPDAGEESGNFRAGGPDSPGYLSVAQLAERCSLPHDVEIRYNG